MDNFSLNNQLYYTPRQGQSQQQQFQAKQNSAQSQSYGGAKEIVKTTNAGYVASKFDMMEHPWLVAQNILLSLAAAIGITALGEHLVKGNFKKMPETISVADALEKAPLARFGRSIDSFIKNIPFLQKTVDGISNFTNRIAKSKKPQMIEEIVQKFKEGSKVTWSMGKPYEEGKGAEAIRSLVDFLEKAPADAFTDPNTKTAVKEILDKVKAGTLSRTDAGRQIVEKRFLENGLSAKHLSNVQIGENKGISKILDKLFGTTPNLYSALSKAKFYDNKTTLGPVSKALNKLSLMVIEATGGGILGGKAAIVMSIVGLITAFNAISKAHVAKKEKQKQLAQGDMNAEQIKEMKKGPWSGEMTAAFMEDLSGFTLGAYLMTFPLGLAVNKALGLAHLGRDEKAVKAAAKLMDVKDTKQLYQNSVIKYNETIKQDKIARKYRNYLEGKGNLPIMDRIKKFFGFSSEASIQAKIVEKLKLRSELGIAATATEQEVLTALKTTEKTDILTALGKRIKDGKWFTDRKQMIKTAGKSTLTLKSVRSGKEGSFGQRLAKYLVQKPLELSAKILGFEKHLMYTHNAGFRNFFKNIAKGGGGVGRVILVGMVLTAPFRNLFMKVSHAIFGKPSFSQYDELKGVYDDKKEDAKEEIAKVASKTEFQKIKLPTQPMQMMNSEPQAAETSLMPAYQQKISISNPYQNQINPSSEIAGKDENDSNPVRKLDTYTYVPGQ